MIELAAKDDLTHLFRHSLRNIPKLADIFLYEHYVLDIYDTPDEIDENLIGGYLVHKSDSNLYILVITSVQLSKDLKPLSVQYELYQVPSSYEDTPREIPLYTPLVLPKHTERLEIVAKSNAGYKYMVYEMPPTQMYYGMLDQSTPEALFYDLYELGKASLAATSKAIEIAEVEIL